jgi:hypothetical protein
MSKCDDSGVGVAFQKYVELYLDKEGSWINTATEPKAKKANQNSKSNFIKVIEYRMTLLSVEENGIRRTKQPKDRSE